MAGTGTVGNPSSRAEPTPLWGNRRGEGNTLGSFVNICAVPYLGCSERHTELPACASGHYHSKQVCHAQRSRARVAQCGLGTNRHRRDYQDPDPPTPTRPPFGRKAPATDTFTWRNHPVARSVSPCTLRTAGWPARRREVAGAEGESQALGLDKVARQTIGHARWRGRLPHLRSSRSR